MRLNYRIKLLKNSKQDQPCEQKETSFHNQIQRQQSRYFKPKRSRSQIMFSVEQLSPEQQNYNKRTFLTPNRHTFSKIRPISLSPEQVQNRSRSKTVPENSGSSRINKLENSQVQSKSFIKNCINEPLPQKPKLPYYVTRSSQMIQTKQKLLHLKHQIRLNGEGPILESIQQSINEDKVMFSRKMKKQLSKNGQYSLIQYLQKNLKSTSDQQQKSGSNSKSKSKQKQYKPINLSYLINLRNSDLKINQKSQKMSGIKKKLKNVRKTNLIKIKSKQF